MNPYLIAILAIIIGEYLLETIVELLNLGHSKPELPAELADHYDAGRYRQSQKYLRENTRLQLLRSTVQTLVLLLAILLGAFNLLDLLARRAASGEIVRGLVFAALLALAGLVMNLPFGLYHTFALEARYGFNQTTPKTYALDMIKGIAIGAIIGSAVFAGIIWFFDHAGELAWVWAWGALTLFQIVLMWLAPVVIMPLFNKFTPLEPGELRSKIEAFAQAQSFPLAGIFTMDGSKRSTKANAFFVGFGKFRRIVLFDTLVKSHTPDELLLILAHEIGHFKLRHLLKQMLLGILSGGLLFYVLSLAIKNPGIFAAFRMTPANEPSIYASLVFVSLLFSPVSTIIGVVGNTLSRRFEYQADSFAARTCGEPEALVRALTTLSSDHLANLTPHPLKVFLDYSHPPLLARVRALNAAAPTEQEPPL